MFLTFPISNGMEILSKLFGGVGIVKMLRLFLFNPDHGFETKDIVDRTKVDTETVRSELAMLQKIDFIKKKTFYKESLITTKRRRTEGESSQTKRKRVSGWILNENFAYLKELHDLLIGTIPLETDSVVKRIKKAGNVKLVIIAGVFAQRTDSRVDILVVGDNIKQAQLTRAIKDIESELGREMRYAVFETQDFNYRMSIYDRLIRDVFDYPHHVVVDRIGIESTTHL